MYRILAVAIFAFAMPRAHADVGQRVDFQSDRARALDAVATVDADQRALEVQVFRVTALRSAWNRAVAANDVKSAGSYAVAHFVAVRDEKAARKKLARDRDDLHVARLRLTADEFQMQHPKNGRG